MCECFIHNLAVGEGFSAGIQGIGPAAVSEHNEIAVGACNRVSNKFQRRVIGVGRSQRARGARRGTFGHHTTVSADDWQVAATDDVDRNSHRRRFAISRSCRNGEGFGHVVGCTERLRGHVIDRKGPHSACIDRKGAVGSDSARLGSDDQCVDCINIGCDKRARNVDDGIFADGSGAYAGDRRRVFAAVDCDGDARGNRCCRYCSARCS